MPTLRHSSSASSSACSSTTFANRCIVRPRVTGDSAPHVSYALAAAATARLTSSTPASATVASGTRAGRVQHLERPSLGGGQALAADHQLLGQRRRHGQPPSAERATNGSSVTCTGSPPSGWSSSSSTPGSARSERTRPMAIAPAQPRGERDPAGGAHLLAVLPERPLRLQPGQPALGAEQSDLPACRALLANREQGVAADEVRAVQVDQPRVRLQRVDASCPSPGRVRDSDSTARAMLGP